MAARAKQYDFGDEILRLLRARFQINESEFAALKAGRSGDPFRVLVATIISQNTNERNTFLAFERLEREVGVDPASIVAAGVKRVEEAIRVAGLQKQKAEAIVAAAELVLRDYGGDLGKLLREGEERVRAVLGGIRGIGEKTVDVLLAFSGFPVVPVDTHVRRVAKRLGIAAGSSYEAVRESLHRVFREEYRLEAHLLLIKLGRELCKARSPQCPACPLSKICPSAELRGKG
ncbi:MAG: endonuclease III [Thermofilaceae archaeon]